MKTAVAIALYNGKPFLQKQLDSIRLQTQIPNQVILCDDGSSDGTVAFVKQYIEMYQLQPNWKLVINERNLGYARNFFKAMSLCEADIIFLCDQDDIWKLDKVEKMTKVMECHPEIDLLSCKFEMIDAKDSVTKSILIRKSKQTYDLKQVSTEALLRSFYWLGMLMCVRSTFLKRLQTKIWDVNIAHDRILSHCSADRGSFFEFDYTGAYHRRHDNNTAKEESRIFKLLDLKRKLRDMQVYNMLLSDMLSIQLPISQASQKLMEYRLELAQKREQAIRRRKMGELFTVYRKDNKKMLRFVSLLCDIWLICFGNYRQLSL